jgi:HSP20 family protein
MTTQLVKFLNRGDFLDHNIFEPWDIMFKDLFNRESLFMPAETIKSCYPTDTWYEDDKQLNIEIAVPGLDDKDIKIEEEDGILRVSYEKNEENCCDDPSSKCEENGKYYIQRSIARRSFNLAWKFSKDKFDLDKIDAVIDKGLVKITIPKSEEKKAARNVIKLKQLKT